MTLRYETTHEYYIKDASVLWCKEHDGLVITQDWEDQIRINGVTEEIMKNFVHGLFKNYPELAKEFRETSKEKAETTSLKASKDKD